MAQWLPEARAPLSAAWRSRLNSRWKGENDDPDSYEGKLEPRTGVIGELAERVTAFNEVLAADGAGKLVVDARLRFAGANKGLKTLTSMQDALRAELVAVLAESEVKTKQRLENRQALRNGVDWLFLFPDFNAVGEKGAEDFAALLALRQMQHREAEASREARATAVAAVEPAHQEVEQKRAANEPIQAPAIPQGDELKLGELNVLIAPCTVGAAALEALGFKVVKKGAASVISVGDVPAICDALIAKLVRVRDQHGRKAA